MVQEVLAGADFVEGKLTPGTNDGLFDDGVEAKAANETVSGLVQFVGNAMFGNSIFQVAILPKLVTSIIFSRLEEGMDQGTQVDVARMGGWRADVSFTLFLNDPADYDGGELALQDAQGEQLIKLPPGEMVTYPSATLQRVAPVTRGTRLCAVGWVRSLVRDPAQREILYDLEVVRNRLYERDGPTQENTLLMKSILNLQRRWMDD